MCGMRAWDVDRVALMHFVEATKSVMTHLSQLAMGGGRADLSAARDPSETYGAVRHVHVHLQRLLSSGADPAYVELSEDDASLLVACAMFAIGEADRMAMMPQNRSPEALRWFDERRRALGYWSLELAHGRVTHIPVDAGLLQTPTVQRLMREIQDKVVATTDTTRLQRVPGFAERATLGEPQPPPPPLASNTHSAPGSFGLPGNAARPPWEAPAAPPPPRPPWETDPGHAAGAGWNVDPAAAGHAPAPAKQASVEGQLPKWLDWPDGPPAAVPPPWEPPPPPRAEAAGPAAATAFGMGMPDARRAGAPTPAAPPAASAPPPRESTDLDIELNVQRVRDPRLRSLLGMDLAAYGRAVTASDYRMALVHVAAILEAVLLDHALHNRSALGLRGTPETWNIESILRGTLGEQFSSLDRGLLFHLASARNLLRPALQLASPVAVTRQTLVQLVGFLRRVLPTLGVPGAAVASPPTSPAAPARGGAFGGPGASPLAGKSVPRY
jgi:hypothetical protein